MLPLFFALPLAAQDAGDALFDTDQVIEMRFTFAEDDHWLQLVNNFNAGMEANVAADLTITDQQGTWTFDSEGGFGDATWTRDGKKWVVETSAMTPDGIRATPGAEESIYVLPVSVPIDVSGELTCDFRPDSLW